MKGQFPWIGRSRGSAGGMTTAKINDKNVMRAKAFEVTNPKTDEQVMQRDFFKQVQEVCASVTKDQLRSLFGVKPKTMTRRNALSKQIAAAYTITNGVKSVDFSKLLAIGNGEKINMPIGVIADQECDFETNIGDLCLNAGMTIETDIIAVIFDTDNTKIVIAKTGLIAEDLSDTTLFSTSEFGVDNGYIYLTCPTIDEDITGKDFGSFIIKTRATN